jgi:hypothetical protein
VKGIWSGNFAGKAFCLLPFLLLFLLVSGCATSTVQTRSREQAAAYAALSPDMRAKVDRSEIAVGMPMDAVYIAWGKPTQISTAQASDGKNIVTWIYSGTTWQEYRYWNTRYYGHGRHGYGYATPTLDYDYIPQSYVAAEVVFEDGIVKNWRNITPPPPY